MSCKDFIPCPFLSYFPFHIFLSPLPLPSPSLHSIFLNGVYTAWGKLGKKELYMWVCALQNFCCHQQNKTLIDKGCRMLYWYSAVIYFWAFSQLKSSLLDLIFSYCSFGFWTIYINTTKEPAHNFCSLEKKRPNFVRFIFVARTHI